MPKCDPSTMDCEKEPPMTCDDGSYDCYMPKCDPNTMDCEQQQKI